MRLALLVLVACSGSPHEGPVDAAADACPIPTVRADCVADGLTTVNPDGAWHLTGMSTTSTETDLDPNTPPTVTTSAVDLQVQLQRFGCLAGLSFNGTPTASPQTAVSMTAMSGTCDHSSGCARGTSSWSVCVNAAGELTYASSSFSTSTMPGDYSNTTTTTGTLTH